MLSCHLHFIKIKFFVLSFQLNLKMIDLVEFINAFCIFIRYDHQERLTAREAQAHPYFQAVREAEARAEGATINTAVTMTENNP